jgi:uncharacterized protein YfbU (UPF0304 family)
MKLSDGEKLILLMLADIYKHLKIKDPEFDPKFITATILDDHLWGFNWQFVGIPFEKEDSPPEVTETVDILDMWSFLEDSYKKLNSADKKRIADEAELFGGEVKFHGFDGNHEPHYGIARYLIGHLDRFESFKGRDMNSHSRSVDAAKRMLIVFEPIRAKLHGGYLSADEIIQILKARRFPKP